MGTLNNTNKLPECPTYIAHPQAVKFREFWIRWHKHWDENNYTDVITDVMTIKRYDDDIHVVEIAALAAKDAEIELVRNAYNIEKQELLNKIEAAEFHAEHYKVQLERLKIELTEKDAVLEFYGDHNNYNHFPATSDANCMDFVGFIEEKEAGDKAREVLQKYEGEG